ncbi:MAG: Galactokinase [Bryobacteraceae bacterium]|nr:Galactokinase [Bryobacteraceae bacterium]
MSRSFSAPGRVNLIGEHTDYNEGFVFPAAIGFFTTVEITPRPDRTVHLESEHYPDTFSFPLDDSDARARHSWTDYAQGVALALHHSGYPLTGANLSIRSDVPMGAGLSSSAALEVSCGLALAAASGHAISRLDLARVCLEAENEFVGMRCGIMDQFVSTHGREDSAILLDCRSLEYRVIHLPASVRLVICNTMVKHQLAGSAYNERRRDCEAAARQMGVRSLRDVTAAMFAESSAALPARAQLRARHVIGEIERTERAAEALAAGDLTLFGRYMHESHESLREAYEVSCAELDLMVELARAQPGVHGSRMTGAGFGGCTINLVDAPYVNQFRREVAAAYREATGIIPGIYVCRAVEGAHEITT